MIVKKACEKIGLKVLAGKNCLGKELTGVYICDLLSWVMAHGKKGDAWITVQTHSNIIAVAALLELACIIIPEEIEVEEETLKKAEEENIPVLQAPVHAYEIAKSLYKLGIE
ncbi:MAG: DRTGG domain-containing protein [Caulobacteraceae bacterium]